MLLCSVAQSCLTLCDPMDYRGQGTPPGSSVHGIFSGKNTEEGCHFLLQGTFSSQGLDPCHLCLLHCRRILYLMSHQGSPQLIKYT